MNSIIETGCYTFHLKEETGQWQMFLEYEPSSLQLPAPSSSKSQTDASKVRKEKWNSEQIGDFVRKLGFVDKDKEKGGERITLFLHFNQVSWI